MLWCYMIDDMGKKPIKKMPELREKNYQMRIEQSLFDELQAESIEDPDGISLAAYIRRLLRTHPDRPANKKK